MKMYVSLDDLYRVLDRDLQLALCVFALITLVVLLNDHFRR